MLNASSELKDALYYDELKRYVSRTDEQVLSSFLRSVDRLAYCGGVSGDPWMVKQSWCIDSIRYFELLEPKYPNMQNRLRYPNTQLGCINGTEHGLPFSGLQ